MQDLVITPHLSIPGAELRVAFARSGGPGGQHVNKTETKVELRWGATTTAAISAQERVRLISRLRSRITADGDLVVTSSRTRDQARNRADAREKMAALIRAALAQPKPRRPTGPSRRAARRRLDAKRRRGRLKDSRRAPTPD